MPSERTCNQCGVPLPENAPGNRCPKCLLALALEDFANASAPERAPTSPELAEQTGTMIGRYKLLQQIGEGGFGVVFMAEQTEPVQRKVALKVIKAGMDTREIVARFEAERQALALMDHPNIARVLDGGATASGRPYFVMELVRGVPITDYCDHANLSTRERLELFIQVCRAVQHAHQKGVIHRDLKPTNVMVTLHDGEPVPKVIDFGVAKALGQKLTDKTLFTRYEQMIGTPAYMSPEQAALSGLDIDTRSDIYSLGVLLYELLTGVTPLDAARLREAALDEVRRMIQETEPPKPSTRLLTLGERLADIAKHRHTEPNSLTRLVRGDLDWITMKALEKDRRRRFETVNDLAADIERHLNQEPVVACPPSTAYKVLKFVCRHRRTVVTVAVIATLLVIGAMVSTWEAVRAWRAEREQSRLLIAAETARANESIQREQAEASGQKAQEEARRSAQVESYTHKLFTDVVNAFFIQREKQLLLEVLDNATDNARNELRDQPLVAATMLSRIGEAYLGMENPKAEGLLKEALDLLKTVPDRGGILHSRTLYRYCVALREQRKFGEAENVLRDLIVSTPKPLPTETNALHRLAEFWSYLSEIQEEQGKLVEAETSLLEWQTLRKSAGEPWFFPGIPSIQERLGKLDAAETQWREYVRHARAQTKPFAGWVFDYVIFLRQRGKYDEVSDLLREVKQSWRDYHAPNSGWRASRQFRLGKSFAELAWDQYRIGENSKAVPAASEAEQLLRESIQLGMNEATYFRMETLPDAKGLLGGALVIKAAADLSKAMNERLALLKEAEPLIKSQLDGSEYLPDADTNTIHQAMLRHNRLYAVWNELAPSAERAALSAQWQYRAAMWIDPTTPYNRAQEFRQQRKFVEAEIVCRQILDQVRNEHTTNATPLLARSLCDLARVLGEQKKHEESFQLLRESLDVLERCEPSIPVFRERVLVELNGLMTLMGNNTQKAAGDFQALQELARLAAAEAQRQACFENLSQINGAKEQWALENSREDNAIPTPKELWGLSGYVRGGELKCSASGTYIIGPVKESARCSVHGSKY